MKKDFDKYKLVYKGKNSNIAFNKNDFLDIQKHTILKKCAFDINKFASLFPKGKTQRKHTPHSLHIHHEKMHNMHIHINISMLSCMARCTRVHIAAAKAIYKILLSKLNMLNKNV